MIDPARRAEEDNIGDALEALFLQLGGQLHECIGFECHYYHLIIMSAYIVLD